MNSDTVGSKRNSNKLETILENSHESESEDSHESVLNQMLSVESESKQKSLQNTAVPMTDKESNLQGTESEMTANLFLSPNEKNSNFRKLNSPRIIENPNSVSLGLKNMDEVGSDLLRKRFHYESSRDSENSSFDEDFLAQSNKLFEWKE